MLMIIIYHIVFHVVYPQLTNLDSIKSMENGLFNHPVVYKKLFILYFIMTFGNIGNAIFIIISGYFMVSKGKNISIAKTGKKIIMQQFFAVVVLMLGSTVLYFISKNSSGYYVGMHGIGEFNDGAWFVGYYFAIILTAYLFLNRFIEKLDKKKYIAFLVIMFAICQFGWIGGTFESLAENLRTYCSGIFLYSLGGFIRKYNPLKKIKTWGLILAVILIYLCVGISDYNSAVGSIENYMQNAENGEFIQDANVYYPNWSIVVIGIAVLIFELFRRIKMPNRRFINFLGAATFMVYLLHDTSLVRVIWRHYDWVTLLYYHPWLFIVRISAYALITFGICVIFYLLYLAVIKLFMKIRPVFLKR